MIKTIILKILVWYKKYVSRGHNCRFVPSCSEYTYEGVKKYGVVRGLWKGAKRVLRCNPLFKGGLDSA